MPLLSSSERQKRAEEKHISVLRWLSTNIYSTARILGQVMRVQAMPPVYRTLAAMERDELITRADVDVPGVTAALYGITAHGQQMAQIYADAAPSERVFWPSLVSAAKLQHTLDIQTLQLAALAAGWTEWQLEAGKVEKHQYRPDVIARDPQGRRWAIEYERTLKTPSRYVDILAAHLVAVGLHTVDRVVWICPDDRRAQHIQKLILRIEKVPVRTKQGTRMATVEARHHAYLRFASANQFPAALSD